MVMNKKAAIEMSLSTIITIVLSVVFLILALVVLRNMYSFQSESVGAIQEKTLKQINQLYLSGEETQRIQIQLGSDKLAKIRAGTDNFGIAILGNTASNAPIQNGSDLQFELKLDDTSTANCIKINGLAQTKAMFRTPLGSWIDSKTFSDSTGGIIVSLTILPTTKTCTQEVYVRARDRTADPAGQILGQDVFTIQVLRKVPFA